jgi:hypothetical protein
MKFVISGNLLRFSDFKNQIEILEPTVEEGLAVLVASFPALEPVLFGGAGRFREVHRIFLNGEQLTREDLCRDVGAEDEVTILTAIARG